MSNQIRRIQSDGSVFALSTVQRPARTSAADVLVKVVRISVNRGEFSFPWAAGDTVGWDAYGVVTESSSDGLGPAVGSRVVTWSFSGAWAEYRVVGRDNLAVVPDSISDEVAAALPVVGLTALRAIRQLDLPAGSAIAVSGATGGVGHVLLQLALGKGMAVTAVVRNSAAAEWLTARGLHVPVLTAGTGEGVERRFDGAFDTVGGLVLGELIPLLAPGGTVLLIGNGSGRSVVLNTADLVSNQISLVPYDGYSAAGPDLEELIALVEAGTLQLDAVDAGDWSRILTESPDALLVRGKATLSVS
jgi:NADPH2:quinone reductase